MAAGRLNLAIALLSIVLLLGGTSYWLARQWNPALSEADLCLVGKPPVEEVIIILDATDSWSPIQRARIAQELSAVQERIPRFARVTMYALESEVDGLPVPKLKLCNPGGVADYADFPLIGEAGVQLVSNPDVIERRWKDGFVRQVDSVFAQQAAHTGTSRSPLMETIRGAAIQAFGESHDSLKRTLYVFSDLLQHSDVFSHYTQTQWLQDDAVRLADLSRVGTTLLDGAEIHLYLVSRTFTGQRPSQNRVDLVSFWDTFFSAQGATVVRVKRIEG